MKRLMKKEIPIVPLVVLNMRYCRILEKGERLPANEIPIAEARELLWIEDELRARIIRAVGHDFYPPDRVKAEKTNPSIKSILAPKREIKSEPKPGTKIRFPIVAINTLGVKVAEFTVEANSKSEADLLARKQIRKLGIKGASHKIS